MLKRGWIILGAVLALAGARQAWAVWSQSQITPGYAVAADHAVTVTTKRDGSLVQFDVSVTSKDAKRPISPYADGSLSVVQGDDFWSEATVKPYWKGDTLNFRFKVSARALEKSRFEIREQGWTYLHDSKGGLLKDSHGKPETEMTLGGQAYWFYLKDFAGQKPE